MELVYDSGIKGRKSPTDSLLGDEVADESREECEKSDVEEPAEAGSDLMDWPGDRVIDHDVQMFQKLYRQVHRHWQNGCYHPEEGLNTNSSSI